MGAGDTGSESIDRLEEIFHHALNLEPEERARFIAGVRDSNPSLAAEVESLIAAHTKSRNLVDSPAYEAAASLIIEAQTEDLTGRSINQYHILSVLGRGGMGEVYRARDTRLNREVALKVLTGAFVKDADRLTRFQREAQMLASLNHPNIAVIYDLVECEGKHVLVLELIEGETLANSLKQGPFPVGEALGIALQIARGLSSAHKKGIIHRDLKPANIKIGPDGQVKVLDFGLAKQVEGSGGDADSKMSTLVQSMTVTGVILGTPGYMSPEQAVGEAADARSDIFSFGAVLYEMLTGRRAFSGNTVTALLKAVLTRDPASPKRLHPEIPADLDAMVMKALRKDRDQRQPDMDQVCSELTRLSTMDTQSGSLAASAGEHLRAATWRLQNWGVENKRKALAVCALAVLAILGAVGRQFVQWRAERSAGSSAPQARVNSDASPYDLFEQGLAHLERYDKQENRDAAFQAFNAAISKDQNYAPAYAGLGLAFAAKFQFNRDKTLLDLAAQNAKHAVDLDGQLAVNRVSLGCAYVARGEYSLAEPELNQALILEPNNPDAYRGLADLQGAKGNAAEAERLYRKAIELRPADWNLHYSLGTLYYRVSRFAEAETAFDQAVKLAPDCHMAHRNLGVVYHMQGRFAEASAEFQKALQINPSASTYSNLGTSLFFQGLYQQSIAAMEKAVELGANNYQTWANLGDAYRQTTGNEGKAREAFSAAIQLVRNELASKRNDPQLLSRLAVYLAKTGEKQAALDQAKAVEGLNTNASIRARLVLVYEICGRRQQALDALAAALRQGYSLEEISRDPELLEMRMDPKYRKLVVQFPIGAQK